MWHVWLPEAASHALPCRHAITPSLTCMPATPPRLTIQDSHDNINTVYANMAPS